MSLFQYKSNHNEIYLHQNMITNMKVDAIVHFIDTDDLIENKCASEIFKKGGSSLHDEFYTKWPKIQDFSSVMITKGGTLECKYVIHTNSFIYKPDTEGYFDASKKKIFQCLNQAKSEKFKSVAFAVNQSGYIGDIILKSYFEVLTTYNADYPKQIHCACEDKYLFEKFKNMFFRPEISLGQPQNPAFGHQTNDQTISAPTVATAEETTMDVDMPDETETNDICPICLCDFTGKKTLDKCGHSFCSACIDRSFSAVGHSCPVCQTVYGQISGQQPPGRMSVRKEIHSSLPGFSGCGTYVLEYYIPDGNQKKGHPNPGKRFYGTSRIAYLPANKEGETVLKMLQKAFLQKLIFTVGTSKTTNMNNTVTWNDIHHKTSRYGGPFQFGYPDPDYLKRVSSELEAKGVNAKSVAHERIIYTLESK